jgi:hypothetical protein
MAPPTQYHTLPLGSPSPGAPAPCLPGGAGGLPTLHIVGGAEAGVLAMVADHDTMSL